MKAYIFGGILVFAAGAGLYLVNDFISREVDGFAAQRQLPSPPAAALKTVLKSKTPGNLPLPDPGGLVYVAPPKEYKKPSPQAAAKPVRTEKTSPPEIIYEIPLDGGELLQ